MKTRLWRLALLLTLATSSPAFSAEVPKTSCVVATDAQVTALFDKWNLTLTTLDPALVADLYWSDAVLLPTVSNQPRTNTALIKDYFVHFLEKHPRGRIDERHLQHGCNMSVDMGLYTFFLLDKNGKPQEVNARYTYVYTYRGGTWKIQHHHSSAMPEPVGAPTAPHASAEPAKAAPTHDTKSVAAAKAPSAEPATAVVAAAPDTPPVKEAADVAPSEPSRPALRARLQRAPPLRTISEFIPKEALEAITPDTVSIKICAAGADATQRSFEVSDPSPKPGANEAALAWARGSNWVLQNPTGEAFPVCTHVVARF